ncbi:hypothetical protein X801_01785 [Opisthorchis viverrini]|uniref:Calponin-homology (CH) domain-containing protein n=1 Tax=Opisthorchis viverrini TaxID=6198 RepID=A0A1S8X6M3_OPIVI|nr:hypothetical protein X801_01785 [Opisthorchis viverrini]
MLFPSIVPPIRMEDRPARHPVAADEAGNSVPVDDHSRMAEKELAEDAQWKLMQRNTFTRWANEHLKKANMHIDNLETDLCDGLRLAALVEVLTNHKFKQLNKKPTFRTQKLENVTKVLKFLEDNEKLRLVSIDSTHIVDSNMKLILGLIWTLIMHYSISLPMWDGDSAIQHIENEQRLRSMASVFKLSLTFPTPFWFPAFEPVIACVLLLACMDCTPTLRIS